MTSSLAYSARSFLGSHINISSLGSWNLPLIPHQHPSLAPLFALLSNGPNVLEDVGVELARRKAENRRMARWLRAKKLRVKWKKKELRQIRRVNHLLIAANKRMQELVDDFLLTAEADNNPVRLMNEAIQGMNDLNLHGNYNIPTVNQVQPCCNSGRAADGDNNSYNRGGGGGNSRGYGGGHDGGLHE
ncbi:uncharacterized protein LOC110415260 [Herrania umbratica]|uniref:Uncharacterized protein LOC110415260 n=1 Tax=Herrania umbratica TaxID=108875 RepID=A0A6J1A737_9ROSI|nr:uncharacterized protein LOC110415260 [Herrania umbratica]